MSDRVFAANNGFYALPKILPEQPEVVFRHQVLLMLRWERRIDDALIKKPLSWPHSGLSIHNWVRIGRQDQADRKLPEYVLRSLFS